MKRKTLLQDPKIALRSGTALSAHFSNCQNCYKVVETDNVLGYVVLGGGRGSAAIYPLYRAFIHMRVGAIWHIVSSHEQGDRLNDYTFQADYQGCTLATIAAQAIAALEARRAVQQPMKQDKSKKRSPRK